MYVLKETNNIFQDILLPFSSRHNERFFYQLIGVPDNEIEYYNHLFLLDRNMKDLDKNCYLKFENSISLGNISSLVAKIRESFKFKDITQKTFVIEKCFNLCDIINSMNSDEKKKVKNIFVSVCDDWYNDLNKIKNITFDMIVNFGIKMSNWLSTYYKLLFLDKPETTNIVPKVLYYGNIKEHEIYFLEMLFQLGCDILYVNTLDFNNLKMNSISKKIIYEKKVELPQFPKEEKIVPHETNALKAQSEVNEMYYDSTTLRPWQLQNHDIKNIPLKITYDELFSLWNVDANMRPGFKVANNMVYIPNLCCKISGVENDIKNFTQKVKHLDDLENVLVFKTINFFNKEKFDRDMNEYISSKIQRNGFKNKKLDKDFIKSTQSYHYRYLRLSLQDLILDTIEKMAMSENTKCQDIDLIMATLLNLDKMFLDLLQNFDFAFAIPKVIVFHNDTNILQKTETIILKFLNLIGVDILFVTPTGYADIENELDETILNMFQLEKNDTKYKFPFQKNNQEQDNGTLLGRIFGLL